MSILRTTVLAVSRARAAERRTAFVAATAVLTTGGFLVATTASRPIHAEAASPAASSAVSTPPPSTPVPVFVRPREKLSIYDAPKEDPIKPEEPSELELAIRQTRYKVTAAFAMTRSQVQKVVDEWLKVEAQAGAVVKKFVAPDEKLLPGAIYTTLAGFAGSIFAKHRSLPARIAAPTTLAATAFVYFYPHTSRNVTNIAYQRATGTTGGPLITDSLPDLPAAVKSAVDAVKSLIGAEDAHDRHYAHHAVRQTQQQQQDAGKTQPPRL
ncbi:hypothetical protein HDU86_005160 [Geranomyces michiganensis]|nr:hypothetical protein HDU86_005160 [Geranomyces michiganensis]